MKKVLKRPNNSAGFTLAETLIAVVILVLISAAALPAAMNAYRNAVDAANAQVLLSTTVNALRDELSTAWNVSVDGSTIAYQSANTGDKSVISMGDNCIMLQEYSRETGEGTPGWWDGDNAKTSTSARPLVSNAMRRTTRNSKNLMAVTYSSASFDGTYVTIKGLQVARDGSVLAKMPKAEDSNDTILLIRVMSTESAGGTGDSDNG